MAEYIEREKAFKLIKEQKEKETGAYSKGRNTGLFVAMSIIKNKEALPNADVVEVVRCKDCKKCFINPFGKESNVGVCNQKGIIGTVVQLDDYCSYGERKEEE